MRIVGPRINGQREWACRKIKSVPAGLDLKPSINATDTKLQLGFVWPSTQHYSGRIWDMRCCGLVQLPRLVSFNSPFLRDWIKTRQQCPSRHVSRVLCRPARHSRWGAFPCVTIQQLGAGCRCLVNAFVYQSRRSFDHAGCHRPGAATCLRDLVETATVES